MEITYIISDWRERTGVIGSGITSWKLGIDLTRRRFDKRERPEVESFEVKLKSSGLSPDREEILRSF